MNVALFQRVKKALKESPEQADMHHWERQNAGPCGTTHCIAGLALTLSGFSYNRSGQLITPWGVTETDIQIGSEKWGAEVLGITMMEAQNLFYAWNWPVDLEASYTRANARVVKLITAWKNEASARKKKAIEKEIRKVRVRMANLMIRRINRFLREPG